MSEFQIANITFKYHCCRNKAKKTKDADWNEGYRKGKLSNEIDKTEHRTLISFRKSESK